MSSRAACSPMVTCSAPTYPMVREREEDSTRLSKVRDRDAAVVGILDRGKGPSMV